MESSPVLLIPHTHWDREWYLPFEEFRCRLVATVDAVLDTLESDEAWVFTLDGQAVALEDYLEIRPEGVARIRALVDAGRLAIGPLYVLPDEWLCSGEAAVRNLTLGTRACAGLGGSAPVGYLPDMFGHVSQMPQLLRRAGLEVAVLWRGADPPEQGLFRWRAPDGSEVTTRYLSRGYGDIAHVPEDPAELGRRLEAALAAQDPYRGPGPDVLCVGTDHRPITPQLLPGLRGLGDGDPDASGYRMGTWGEYFTRARTAFADGDLPVVEGELRSARRAHVLPGTLTSRHRVKQAHTDAERVLVDLMDPALALVGDTGGPLAERAWKLHLKNLAHDTICGCSVDEVHEEGIVRSRKAGELARTIGREALARLAPRDPEGDADLLLLRTVPTPAGSVEAVFEVDPEEPPPALRLGDQVLGTVVTGRRPGRVRIDEGEGRAHLEHALEKYGWGQAGEFMVRSLECDEADVPTLRFRLTRHVELIPEFEPARRWVAGLPEQGTFRVELREPDELTVRSRLPAGRELGLQGLRLDPDRVAVEAGDWVEPARKHPDPVSLGDRTLEVDPQDGSLTFRQGERVLTGLLGVQDVGDRGDEYTHDPCGEDPRPEVRLSRVAYRRLGEAAVELRVEREVVLPLSLTPDREGRTSETAACPMVTTVRMEVGSPVLDVRVRLENRVRDHHLSLRFPLGAKVEETRAGQPFDSVTRPVALPEGEGWTERPLPYFPFQGWFAGYDGERGVTVLSDDVFEYGARDEPTGTVLGLTLIRGTEWLSRDDLETRDKHAGPPMFTPGAQETGTHEYRLGLAITGPEDPGGWELHQAWSRGPQVLDLGGRRRLEPVAGLEVDGPGLIVSSLAPAPEGRLLRVFHPGGEDRRLLRVGGAAAAAVVDLHGEEPQELTARGGVFEVSLAPAEILTLRLR